MEDAIDPIKKYKLPTEFRMARVAARKSSFGRHTRKHMGAALFKSGRFLAIGFNKSKSNTLVSKYTTINERGDRMKHVVVHAELDTLPGLKKRDVSGAVVYVWRESPLGMPLLSRPCIMCRTELEKAGISKVLYTTSSHPYFEEMKIG